ncbi:hypothetical protein CLPU_11c00580 [Gottschalkia purinilytica]|uniref:Uncharacterized protein n=1 Tax=Gottschalkia purinilytica TaxID=1503 RepID=A0A0L0W8L9_GOTPU|nr:hypothetical protein [Gottschalkia purinilytica]KNF07889.1 hypothetical protein CLPU_11c00580 [Gottschalkia purinilytica]
MKFLVRAKKINIGSYCYGCWKDCGVVCGFHCLQVCLEKNSDTKGDE